MDDQTLYSEEIIEKQNELEKRLDNAIVVPIQKYPDKIKAEITNTIIAKIEDEIQLDETPFNDLSDDIQDAIEHMANELVECIIDNKPKTFETITVKNIKDAKTDTVKVNNLQELKSYFTTLEQTIKANKPIVNVQKQVLELPTQANNPIAVRLSDGKSFINQLVAAVSSGSGETDPLVGYQICERDDSGSTKYYGYAKAKGLWYIMRESSSGSYRYAKGTSDFATNWTNRASLTYDYIYEVF